MTDDVEATLASLEQRLRALQSELDAEADQPFAAPVAPPPPAAPSAGDPLDDLAAQLRRLVERLERVAADLRHVEGIASVSLRSYTEGRAVLEVAISIDEQ